MAGFLPGRRDLASIDSSELTYYLGDCSLRNERGATTKGMLMSSCAWANVFIALKLAS